MGKASRNSTEKADLTSIFGLAIASQKKPAKTPLTSAMLRAAMVCGKAQTTNKTEDEIKIQLSNKVMGLV